MKSIIISAIVFLTFNTMAANVSDPYDLSALDVLGTCSIGTQQEVNAELGLSFTKAIFAWHIGDQVSMLHPEFIAWHSAMTDLLVSLPVYRDKVPFKNGQFTKDSIVQTMAFVAYSNDSEAYTANLKRVDCIGDDKVILVADFKSMQIQRDTNSGCITHKVAYESPLKIVLQFKDAKVNGLSKKYVYRFDTFIDEKVTVKAREDLAKLVATQPAMKPEPSSCKTRKMILDEFQSQVKN